MITPKFLTVESYNNIHNKSFEGIYFTSDLHGYHKNIAKGSSNWNTKDGCRDFLNEFEMTDKIINNINDSVSENSLLIDLGDWAFGNKNNITTLREKIKCKNIVHLYGNHCDKIRHSKELQDLFLLCIDYLEISVNHQQFILFHYPIASWNNYRKGAIHLFGHCHQSFSTAGLGKCLDVGVEGHDYKPWHIDEILDYMKNIPVVSKDHHG